jgi:hypothetical protein
VQQAPDARQSTILASSATGEQQMQFDRLKRLEFSAPRLRAHCAVSA